MRCNAKKRILIVLRSVLTITCVAIFFVISGGLVRNYIHGKVIVSSSDTPIGNELVQAPLIALCSRKGFKDAKVRSRVDRMAGLLDHIRDWAKQNQMTEAETIAEAGKRYTGVNESTRRSNGDISVVSCPNDLKFWQMIGLTSLFFWYSI